MHSTKRVQTWNTNNQSTLFFKKAKLQSAISAISVPLKSFKKMFYSSYSRRNWKKYLLGFRRDKEITSGVYSEQEETFSPWTVIHGVDGQPQWTTGPGSPDYNTDCSSVLTLYLPMSSPYLAMLFFWTALAKASWTCPRTSHRTWIHAK